MLKSIAVTVCLVAVCITGTAFVQAYSLPKSIAKGKEVYTTYCQNCHMADGKGQPGVFPPLAKSDYLKKPVRLLIDNILKGQTGELTVNGIKYNGQMLPLNYLTDEQVADVLNYVYNNWGNKSTTTVTPAQVKKARP